MSDRKVDIEIKHPVIRGKYKGIILEGVPFPTRAENLPEGFYRIRGDWAILPEDTVLGRALCLKLSFEMRWGGILSSPIKVERMEEKE